MSHSNKLNCTCFPNGINAACAAHGIPAGKFPGDPPTGHASRVVEENSRPGFLTELEHLVNKYSIENGSGTPDFILAQYIVSCLENFANTVNRREQWYGRTQDRFGMPTK